MLRRLRSVHRRCGLHAAAGEQAVEHGFQGQRFQWLGQQCVAGFEYGVTHGVTAVGAEDQGGLCAVPGGEVGPGAVLTGTIKRIEKGSRVADEDLSSLDLVSVVFMVGG